MLVQGIVGVEDAFAGDFVSFEFRVEHFAPFKISRIFMLGHG